MKKWFLLVLFCSSNALAGSLTIPFEFEFISVNGKPIATNIFSHKDRLALAKGAQIIALKYKDIIEDDFTDSTEAIESAPFYLHFNHDGVSHYQLHAVGKQFTNAPTKFAKNPQVTLSKPGKEAIAFTVSLQPPKINQAIIDSTSNNQAMTMQMLEYWWQQASEKSRQEFINKHLKKD